MTKTKGPHMGPGAGVFRVGRIAELSKIGIFWRSSLNSWKRSTLANEDLDRIAFCIISSRNHLAVLHENLSK